MAKITKAADLVEYVALTPIEHDLVRYEEGATIDLPEVAAAALLAVQAIRLPGESVVLPAPDPEPAA